MSCDDSFPEQVEKKAVGSRLT